MFMVYLYRNIFDKFVSQTKLKGIRYQFSYASILWTYKSYIVWINFMVISFLYIGKDSYLKDFFFIKPIGLSLN